MRREGCSLARTARAARRSKAIGKAIEKAIVKAIVKAIRARLVALRARRGEGRQLAVCSELERVEAADREARRKDRLQSDAIRRNQWS